MTALVHASGFGRGLHWALGQNSLHRLSLWSLRVSPARHGTEPGSQRLTTQENKTEARASSTMELREAQSVTAILSLGRGIPRDLPTFKGRVAEPTPGRQGCGDHTEHGLVGGEMGRPRLWQTITRDHAHPEGRAHGADLPQDTRAAKPLRA